MFFKSEALNLIHGKLSKYMYDTDFYYEIFYNERFSILGKIYLEINKNKLHILLVLEPKKDSLIP